VSAHDVDEYSWDITYLTEAEPKKSAPLTDIVEEYTEGIFSNRNATFDLKDEGWTIEGDHEWLYDWTDPMYQFHERWTLKLSDGAKIRSKTRPLRGYTGGTSLSIAVRIYAMQFLCTDWEDLRIKLVGIDRSNVEHTTYIDVDVDCSEPQRLDKILTLSTTEIKEYYIEVENISGVNVYLRGIGIFEPPHAIYSLSAGDSDTVDGRHASEFPLLSGSNTFTGTNTFRTVSITPQTTSEIPLTVKSLQTTAPLGPELVQNGTFDTDQYWTWGTGWVWDSTNKEADHQTGNTVALTQNISVTSGRKYLITFTIRNRTTGSISVTLGGAQAYGNIGTTSFSGNATYQAVVIPTSSGSLTLSFNPTSDFNGSIDDVSVKEILTTQPHMVTLDMSGTISLELRSDYNGGSIGIGRYALQYLLGNNFYDIAIGTAALSNNLLGGQNTGIGYYALYNNITGNNNVAIGNYSLWKNTHGYQDIAIGPFSLYSNTTGWRNIAIGDSALYNNLTSIQNIAIGYASLYKNTYGNFNIAIGDSSLSANTTGSANIAIGGNAGTKTSSGSDNQTSSNSIYIGPDTRALANGDTNEIVIGLQAVGAGSNSVVIGNDSITKTYLKGKLAIGYTGTLPTPHSYLQPNGSVAFPITSTNANLTLTDAHYTVLVDASGGSRTITLPSASGVDGRIYVVKKTDDSTNIVAVQAQTGQTIDGGASFILVNQYATVMVQAYGGNWYIVSYYGGVR
jgi:hypothetical protein